MFNFIISSWLIKIARLKAVKKSLTSKNLSKRLIIKDVSTVFKMYKKEKLVNISYLVIPLVEDLYNLSLELNKISLLIKSKKGEALV
jgi:hypothetical protein